jgi:predicted nucleic acid-binding protein
MIILDTSCLAAYFNEADDFHSRALNIIKDIDDGKYGIQAINDYIFSEFATVMMLKTKNMKTVTKFGSKLLKTVALLKIDENTFNESLRVFNSQPTPTLSFVDCSIIATCKINNIAYIATFDAKLGKASDFKLVN